MIPNRHVVAMIALCVLVGAMVVLMSRGSVQPLIPILP
jgi:hypothetical protein